MMSARRVVVTGIGMVTPLGVGAANTFNSLLGGKSGVGKIDRYLDDGDARKKAYAGMASRIAALVPRGAEAGEFDPAWFSTPECRVMSLAMKFGMMAADEAVEDAAWKGSDLEEEQRMRTGVSVGMAIPDLEYIAACDELVASGKGKKMGPYFVPRILPNLAPGHISIAHGFRGPNNSVSTACATGSHAVGDGYRFIQAGSADVMVCGGTDACVCPLAVAGFVRARALSTRYNDNPERASRPFDKDRDGFVIGEGAGILVLEELEHALSRGAPRIYAEIIGFGASGDASHITAGRDDGSGGVMAMKDAVRDTDLADLWLVNAHATSTPKGDSAELNAVRRLLESGGGPRTAVPHMVSHKGQLGHLLGAAGSVEAGIALLSLQHGAIPGNANLESLDEGLESSGVNLVRENVIDVGDEWIGRRRLVLKNSFGFGGTNVSLLFAEYKS